MQKNKKYIFFYSHLDRHFRSTLIGHLFLLMQEHDVILFSDNLKKETLSILNDNQLFPKLIIINLYQSKSKNIFINNVDNFRNNTKIFDKTFKKYNCKCLATSSDWHSLNEFYLMRIAKNMNIFRFSIQESVHWNTKLRKKWYFLRWNMILANRWFFVGAETLYNSKILNFFINIIPWSKYIFFQFLIPIFSLKSPFLTKKNFFLWNGASGCNDSQYHLTFSPLESDQYKISGTDIDKLQNIPHPFTLNETKILRKIIYNNHSNPIDFLIIIDSFDFSFKKDTSLIPKEIKLKSDINIVKSIAKNFHDKKIVIKPHPNLKNYIFFKDKLKHYENVTFMDQSISVDNLFPIANTLIAFSPSFSTSSIYFKLFYPSKKSIALDFFNEYNGDFFVNNKYDVNYIKSMNELNAILYEKNNSKKLNKNFKFDFENINQFLNEKLN